MCSFSNIGFIGIQIWGIGAIALSHQGDFARLGPISNPLFINIVNSMLTVNITRSATGIDMRAMIAGSVACFMTASIAGMLLLNF
ncbi:hypothetical protein [Tychonema sp. LEGE 06208]|uniref:hypothetical protein n=1 Tax=Tychonema sp. LEGE 06208 TaxID=1828663 RepID=UPI00187F3E13|nr:hypothetical protein [Tychonema sp. LEGE 06208]MBE9163784.1 hypothetical protein [Tychonema sp. LEGE 06208]